MRIGIIADIHGNLEAFQVALKVLKDEGVDEIVCLGDIIGYNANPRECLEIIMKDKIMSIRGNHERYVIGEIHESVKADTLQITEWTRVQLANEHYEFLEAMPNKKHHEAGFMMTHGSPKHKDEYLLKLNSFVENLRLLETKYPDVKVCFHGHTHVPSVMSQGHFVQKITSDREIPLEEQKIYLINPGSVGQPRDGSNLSSFLIYDMEKQAVFFYRREYDINTAQKKTREIGFFAQRFADRLIEGK